MTDFIWSQIKISSLRLKIESVRRVMPFLADTDRSVRQCVSAKHHRHGQIAHARMVRHREYVRIRNAHPLLPRICGLDSECLQKEPGKPRCLIFQLYSAYNPYQEDRLRNSCSCRVRGFYQNSFCAERERYLGVSMITVIA